MDDGNDMETLSVGELAERGGVSRRTVRYYVQRGLLDAPAGLGRGAHYTAAHLARLVQIRELQEAGVALDDVQRHLDGAPPATTPPTPVSAPSPAAPEGGELWRRLRLADGVELSVRAGALGEAQLRALLHAAQAALGEVSHSSPGLAPTTSATTTKEIP